MTQDCELYTKLSCLRQRLSFWGSPLPASVLTCACLAAVSRVALTGAAKCTCTHAMLCLVKCRMHTLPDLALGPHPPASSCCLACCHVFGYLWNQPRSQPGWRPAGVSADMARQHAEALSQACVQQTACTCVHVQRCRDKDTLIAELHRKLSQASFSSTPAKAQSHDSERPASAGGLSTASQGLDLAGPRDSPFGGVPRPKSAATSQQLSTGAPSGKKGRMLRAGSHLDKGAASLNSLQAYYRQPALRVRFTPGQLEELSKGVSGPSHKEWAATLKLPGVQSAAQ